MKKWMMLGVTLIAMLLMTGCGPSLAEYVAMSRQYSAGVANNRTVSVDIEPNDIAPRGSGVFGAITAAVNTASAVSAIAVSADQQQRLQGLINPQEVSDLVQTGFNDGFAGTTHLTVVNSDANPDIRVMMHVRNYGLWADSILSPMNFYVECDVQIIYAPEMKKIYSSSVVIRREVSNLFSEIAGAVNGNVEVHGHVGSATFYTTHAISEAAYLVNGAANLQAFFELTDEQIKVVMDYMAYDAGQAIASRLVNAIYR